MDEELTDPVVRMVFEVEGSFVDKEDLSEFVHGLTNAANSFTEKRNRKLNLKWLTTESRVDMEFMFEKSDL